MLTGLDRILADAGLAPGGAGRGAARHHGRLEHAPAEAGRALPASSPPRGFRDVLEIGRLRTPGMFDLRWDKPEPLVPRRWRREVRRAHRCADGSVLLPRRPRRGRARPARFLAAEGVASVAICFLNSYANPANERAAAAALAEAFPALAVTASVDVLPEAGEYERTSTAAVNAYVLPALRGYLGAPGRGRCARRGVTAPLLIGNSNGGLPPPPWRARSRSSSSPPAAPRARSAPSASGAAIGEADLDRLRHGRHHRLGRADRKRRARPHPRIRVPRRHLHARPLHQGRRLHDARADGRRGRGRQRRRLDRRHRRRRPADRRPASRPAPTPARPATARAARGPP